ncbi:GNAT family N-acetyltransferase [Halobacillus salinus]|uniref:GNAT family N-acetyltransferase n=1 Tax=Halobacillus salinus TaxID=192814 RepID=A0A4Z0GX77_9BACI|nr:GNAT family N-acetyltransferase [Halobacillus salinus]TGB02345.1 GNAT family N-acetyltransferase [Halobacillus salinus]
MINIRVAEDRDESFLRQMLYEAIHIPEDKPPQEELLNAPHLRRYNKDWGRSGDFALVAYTDEKPAGAAWYRLFPEDEKGYGFVDERTPEIGIALTSEVRGKGIGKRLLSELIRSASDFGYPALSLSVDPKNERAVQLYQRIGFKRIDNVSGSYTMVYRIDNGDSVEY